MSPPGRIVYVQGGDIWSVAPDGTDARQLTGGPADDRHPRVSPDGRTIAFSSDRDGNQELYLMDADGGDVRRLTDYEHSDMNPEWSPTGELIVFRRSHTFESGFGTLHAFELFTIRPSTGEVQQVTVNATGSDEAHSVSPDGRSVVYATIAWAQTQAYGIARSDLDGTNRIYLSVPPFSEDWDPQWGRSDLIAYSSYQNFTGEVWLTSPDGTDHRPVVSGYAAAFRPRWSRAGDVLAFAARTTPYLAVDLYLTDPLVDPATGPHRRIGAGAPVAWAPDDSAILVDIEGQLAVQDRAGAHPPRYLGAPAGDADWGAAEAPPVPVCDGLQATIVGGPGDDRLVGTEGADVIVDVAGGNVVIGLGGDDRICTGSGADTIYAGAGADRVWAGGGADVVWGGEGDDVLGGGAGDDVVHGGPGRDVLLGGPGADRLLGGPGRDLVVGGPDDDACADRFDLRRECEVLLP
jgi:dipeptidyl aminopeptidase/acylaminoacyl peptidase